jgi:hypothetical protein
MCDYSLHNVASRPARVGDKLQSTNFIGTITRGFAEVGEPSVAVCLLPGTEIAFDREVSFYDSVSGLPTVKVASKVARFRQIDKEKPHVHHDALEFADGQIVLLTHLCEGQHATVLQLPAVPRPEREIAKQQPARSVEHGLPLIV